MVATVATRLRAASEWFWSCGPADAVENEIGSGLETEKQANKELLAVSCFWRPLVVSVIEG